MPHGLLAFLPALPYALAAVTPSHLCVRLSAKRHGSPRHHPPAGPRVDPTPWPSCPSRPEKEVGYPRTSSRKHFSSGTNWI